MRHDQEINYKTGVRGTVTITFDFEGERIEVKVEKSIEFTSEAEKRTVKI